MNIILQIDNSMAWLNQPRNQEPLQGYTKSIYSTLVPIVPTRNKAYI